MFLGVKHKIGEDELTIPALSLGQLRNGGLALMKEHDELVNADKSYDALDVRAKIILLAIQRNYPDFPEQKLLDNLDLNNTTPVWLTVLGLSGFTSGEDKAATAATEPGISSPSIAA